MTSMLKISIFCQIEGKAHSPGLTWAERLHIAHQAAQGFNLNIKNQFMYIILLRDINTSYKP